MTHDSAPAADTIATFDDKTLTVSVGSLATMITTGDIADCWHALSFVPERRARFELGALCGRLNHFQGFAAQIAAEGGKVDPVELERFALRHISLTRRAWAVESRCMSSMIVGPAKFPVERNRKRQAASDNAYRLVSEHEKAARASVERRAFPHGRPEGAVRASNPDAPAMLRARIQAHRDSHAAMKAANAALRKLPAGSTDEAMVQAVVDATGWRAATALKAVTPDVMGQRGFAAYALSGELAEIKRLEDRLQAIERNRARGEVRRTVATTIGDIDVVEDGEAARIRMLFPGRPDERVRGLLKTNAFRWSPSEGAWQRHLNTAGRWAVERVLQAIGLPQPAAEAAQAGAQ